MNTPVTIAELPASTRFDTVALDAAELINKELYSMTEFTEDILAEMKSDDATTLVAVGDDAGVVGVAKLKFTGGKAQIGEIGVRYDSQGSGIGRELMDRAEKLAVKRGALVMHIEATSDSLGFYERLGYTTTKPADDELSLAEVQKSLQS